MAEIAKIRGQDVIDAFLDLSLEEGLDTEFQTSSTNGDEVAVAEIIRSPYVLVGQSDAGAHLIYDAGFGYATRLLGLFLVLPVFALYAQTLDGYTPALMGFALGVYGLTQACLQLPFGIASDRLGRKPVISVGLVRTQSRTGGSFIMPVSIPFSQWS